MNMTAGLLAFVVLGSAHAQPTPIQIPSQIQTPAPPAAQPAPNPPPPWTVEPSSQAIAPSTAPPSAAWTSTSTAHAGLGTPLDLGRGGPWVIGEVLFFSNDALSTDYSLRDKTRAARGSLYTRNDVLADVDSLMATNKFLGVTPSLYEIPNSPIPPELAAVAVSTSAMRLVFDVLARPVVVSTTTARKFPPAALSGVILTPTAYRGLAKYNTPGLGLDINAIYIIGRLYGKNSYANSPSHTNYIDRVGVWLLGGDGKMQIQSETDLRPAVAFGAQGYFMFRDAPQPAINSGPSLTVNPQQKTTRMLSDAYFVASKKIGPVRASAGVMQGTLGQAVMQFSEFLTPDALHFYAGRQNFPTDFGRTMPFVSLLTVPKLEYPLAVEVIKFNGAPLNPILFNFKIGYFLHLNFDIGYLQFQGGWDLLGLLQFRFNQFPR